MKAFYVYILECSDGSYYVGMTSDVERRIGEHRMGVDERCYTYKRPALACVHISEFAHFDDAMRFEKKIKGWSRKKTPSSTGASIC